MSLKERLIGLRVSSEEPQFITAPFDLNDYRGKKYRLTIPAMQTITRLLRDIRSDDATNDLLPLMGLRHSDTLSPPVAKMWLERLYILSEHPGEIVISGIDTSKSDSIRVRCQYGDTGLWVSTDIVESYEPNPNYIDREGI